MSIDQPLSGDRSVRLGQGRAFLMGAAIVWIMFFHYRVALKPAPFLVLNEFFSYGFFGVDIFLFLSAYGLCFSFHKNSDLPSYLGRRAKRILPFYLLNVLFLQVYFLCHGRAFSLAALVGNLTFTGYYFGLTGQTNWYLQAMWVFYFLFPFLFSFLNGRKRLTVSALALALLSLLLLPVIRGSTSIYYYIVCRLPAFLFGILFGIRALRGQKTSLAFELGSYALFAGTYILYTWACRNHLQEINANGLRWTLMVPMLFGVVFLGCRVRQLLSRWKPGRYVVRFVEELGACSMELMVVHLLFRSTISGFLNHRLLYRLFFMVISVVIAIVLHRLIDLAVSRAERLLAARTPDA